jgi:hypothetical protein
MGDIMPDEFPFFFELSSFIGDKINSFEKWDIIVYFCRQVEARESIPSLTALTGKPEFAVQRAADEFVAERILSVRHSNNGKPDLYQVSAESKSLLEMLRLGLDDRRYRFKLMMMALENIRSHSTSLQEEKP